MKSLQQLLGTNLFELVHGKATVLLQSVQHILAPTLHDFMVGLQRHRRNEQRKRSSCFRSHVHTCAA